MCSRASLQRPMSVCVTAADLVTALSVRRVPTSRLVLLSDHGRCNLHVEVVAELPQFLCSTRVLEEDSIDVECINFTGTVAIDGFADTCDEFAQLRLVVVRDHRARRPSFRLAGHESEVTHRLVSRIGRARRPGGFVLGGRSGRA